jgi:hypothetical protein
MHIYYCSVSPKSPSWFYIHVTVESLQSHMILTMSHWSSGLTCLLPATRVTGSNPQGGYLCETGILLLAMSHYIGDPDVIDRQQDSPPQLSLSPRADNVTVPLDLTQLSCPGFTLAAGLPSSFTTDVVGCWGGALWRACNLKWFSACLTGPVD